MVPVVDINQIPLMPCSEKRARRMIESRNGTPFWKKGIFCIRLNKDPSARTTQPIAVGIDPGSKKEGYTVKSEAHTLLNINADAVTWVKDAVKTRREMRQARRFRKTPCRKNRTNRKGGQLPPSTKARWGWKIRICNWLRNMYPITDWIVEDIKAITKGKKRWDQMFSPLEVGKNWFYGELHKFGALTLRHGWETKELRDAVGLKKSKKKLAPVFSAHCVDSWVLANLIVGGHTKPENEKLSLVTPLRLHRRQLHYLQPRSGGERPSYGGTRSLGFKRGSLVRHPKWGLTYVGGTAGERVSLLSLSTGKRVTRSVKPPDLVFLTYNTWRVTPPFAHRVVHADQ